LLLAHVIEGVHVSLAVTFAFEVGICVILVDSLSFQICEPRLYVSGRDEDRHSFVRLTSFIFCFEAGTFNLFYSGGNVYPVGVDEHYQCLFNPVLPRSIVGKLLREAVPHELFTCPTASWTDLNPLDPKVSPHPRQESPGKNLMLPVFTQDDHMSVPAHCSHPLAMTSDSFSPPSTAISLDGRTVVAPELSGLRTTPRSLPR